MTDTDPNLRDAAVLIVGTGAMGLATARRALDDGGERLGTYPTTENAWAADPERSVT